MTACCGLNCNECPTYLATQQDDDTARTKVAVQWSKMFGMHLTARDINCDGCLSGSTRMFGHCANCQIRTCCQQKHYETCAECKEYPCDHLNAFFKFAPHARNGLEAIRSKAERR
ncbi:MAG: DUF3795 domain-containing protein [Desulfatitalea sp.]